MQDTAPDHLRTRLVARLLAAALLAGTASACTRPNQTTASASSAPQTRVLPWTGGDQLFVGVDADVRYVPGANAKVEISGPADEIQDIVVNHGAIQHDQMGWGWWGWNWWDWGGAPPIHIVVTAPHLSAAAVGGSGHLDLGALNQDRLNLMVSGSGGATASGAIRSLNLMVSGSGGIKLTGLTTSDVVAGLSGSGWMIAAGSAESLRLNISGSGRADMSGLTLQDLQAGLSGSGSALTAPKRSADIGVSGSGSVRLLTSPAHLNTHRSGSGSIIRPDGRDEGGD
jgi:hypothetical protein